MFHGIHTAVVWRHQMISELITRGMPMNESSWVTVKVPKPIHETIGARSAHICTDHLIAAFIVKKRGTGFAETTIGFIHRDDSDVRLQFFNRAKFNLLTQTFPDRAPLIYSKPIKRELFNFIQSEYYT